MRNLSEQLRTLRNQVNDGSAGIQKLGTTLQSLKQFAGPGQKDKIQKLYEGVYKELMENFEGTENIQGIKGLVNELNISNLMKLIEKLKNLKGKLETAFNQLNILIREIGKLKLDPRDHQQLITKLQNLRSKIVSSISIIEEDLLK